MIEILKKYSVDPERGFLPTLDPLTQLPDRFNDWEHLAKNLNDYINAGIIRENIDELPVIENLEYDSIEELERAMLLLSSFAHAYVHLPPTPRNYIPPSIAIPWVKVATELKRKPILSHSSNVLYNWRRLDTQKPIQMNNLATLCQFHGGLDENWFYLITVEIEYVGAKAIPLVMETMTHIENQDFQNASTCLQKVNNIIIELIQVLKKMYLNCDPHIFYLRVRPFLASFEEVEYRGTDLPSQSHHGGSAAQSSLLQFFDAALGIDYTNGATNNYLKLMRKHMPVDHAQFLAYIEQKSTIRDNVHKDKSFEMIYKKSSKLLMEFRNEHLKIVAIYIIKQAKLSQKSAIGTGGTNPMVFLKSVRNQHEDLL